MTCRILLLIILNSCLCAATFVVNVTQSSYQAEEKNSITLEWSFTNSPESCLSFKVIKFTLKSDHNVSVLHQVHEGAEVSESQDEQFAGRVQIHKDVLREGRVRLHVSRLSAADSGLYVCEMQTDCGYGSAASQLDVTAAADPPRPQKPTVDPEPDRGGWSGLHVLLGLITAAAATVLLFKHLVIPPVSESSHSKVENTVAPSSPTADEPDSVLKPDKTAGTAGPPPETAPLPPSCKKDN